MGAWGTGTFEDDIACDWIEDLGDSDPIAFFRHCLDLSGQESGLEYVACVGVVCTAEMIHGVLIGERSNLPATAMDWIRDNRSIQIDGLVMHAMVGLCRVIGPDSEMRQLWEDDAERLVSWIDNVTYLLNRFAIHQQSRLAP